MRKTDPLAYQQLRYRELSEALGRARTAAERAELGAAVTQLQQQVEAAAAQLVDLLEDLRALTEEYGLRPQGASLSSEGVAPPPPAERNGAVSDLVRAAWEECERGEYEKAQAELREALALAPDDAEALSSLGWTQTLSQQYDDALLTYQQLLVVNPGDLLARVNLGYICLRRGIYGEAIEHLSKAIRDGDDTRSQLYGHYYLGLVYMAREMLGDAESFFQKTVCLAPGMSEAHFQLGRVRYLAGRKADAVSAWRDGAASGRLDYWATRCAEAARAAESGGQPLLD